RIAAGFVGISLDEGASRPGGPPPLSRPSPPPALPPLDTETFDLLAERLLEAAPLQREPDACAYLRERGILGEVIGYWGALPATRAGLGRVRAACVAAVGLEAWERSGLAQLQDSHRWVWSAYRLIIPWRGPGVQGAIQALQRRLLREQRIVTRK